MICAESLGHDEWIFPFGEAACSSCGWNAVDEICYCCRILHLISEIGWIDNNPALFLAIPWFSRHSEP
jgi:hypothetical protein